MGRVALHLPEAIMAEAQAVADELNVTRAIVLRVAIERGLRSATAYLAARGCATCRPTRSHRPPRSHRTRRRTDDGTRRHLLALRFRHRHGGLCW